MSHDNPPERVTLYELLDGGWRSAPAGTTITGGSGVDYVPASVCDALVGVLLDVEWSGTDRDRDGCDVAVCPRCELEREWGKHEDCDLDAALTRAGFTDQPSRDAERNRRSKMVTIANGIGAYVDPASPPASIAIGDLGPARKRPVAIGPIDPRSANDQAEPLITHDGRVVRVGLIRCYGAGCDIIHFAQQGHCRNDMIAEFLAEHAGHPVWWEGDCDGDAGQPLPIHGCIRPDGTVGSFWAPR